MNLENELKKHFPVERLSWRVGRKTNWDNKTNKIKDPSKDIKALMLVYIDARDVQDRLDEACGVGGWCCEHKSVSNRNICRIGIKINNEWVFKEDGAGDTDFEAEKGGLSDAFKRAAVLWGVGRYLYNASDFNTYVKIGDSKEVMADFDIYKKNKEYLDGVAVKISKTVKLSIEMATPEQLKELEALEVNFEQLCKAFKLSHLSELTFEMAEKAIAKKKEQK